jgi:phosphoribosylanthranilate isomerase
VTRVKICGLRRAKDVEAAVAAGADAVGFVVDRASPRYVDALSGLAELASLVPPYVASFAVYGKFPPESEEELFEAVRWTSGLQVAEIPARLEDYPARFVCAVRPNGGPIDYTRLPLSRRVSAYLLDAYDPEKHGGTGKRVDLGVAAEFVRYSPKPVILAGGLTPENVGEAIRRVRPYGVDVSSGVEAAPGEKSPDLIAAFVEAVRAAT